MNQIKRVTQTSEYRKYLVVLITIWAILTLSSNATAAQYQEQQPIVNQGLVLYTLTALHRDYPDVDVKDIDPNTVKFKGAVGWALYDYSYTYHRPWAVKNRLVNTWNAADKGKDGIEAQGARWLESAAVDRLYSNQNFVLYRKMAYNNYFRGLLQGVRDGLRQGSCKVLSISVGSFSAAVGGGFVASQIAGKLTEQSCRKFFP